MSNHICINICIYTIFLNKNWERVSSELQSICLLVSCVCLIRKLNSPGVEEKYNIGVDIINQLTSSEIHRGTGAYPLTPEVGSLTCGPRAETTSSAAHGSASKRWRWLQRGGGPRRRAPHGSPDAAVLLQSSGVALTAAIKTRSRIQRLGAPDPAYIVAIPEPSVPSPR
jgi:hypothetical protein